MNFITHFLTGYGIARGMKYQNDQFEAFYLSVAAVIPDFDMLVGFFWPGFAHGVFSHTILGGLLFAFGLFGFTLLLLRSFFAKLEIKWSRLLGLTMLGLASHFLLDISTFNHSGCADDEHLYFWPLWNFPVQMNCIWPSTDFTARVIVEVVYTAAIVILIVFYDWCAKKHNLFYMFVPKFWWRHTKDHLPADQMRKTPYIYLFIFIAVEILMIANYGL